METFGYVRMTLRLLHKSNQSKAVLLQQKQALLAQRQYHHQRQHQHQHEGGRQGGGGYGAVTATAATAAALAYTSLSDNRLNPCAEEDVLSMRTVLYENRVRQYFPPDQIFNYFATYLVEEKVTVGGRRGKIMMTPMDLFNAITPESPGHEDSGAAGAGNYIRLTEEAAKNLEKLNLKQSSVDNSVLNKIGKCGLLNYNDFCFLLTVLSTPSRYLPAAFRLFDITGDGHIEAKEFAYLCSKYSPTEGGYGTYQLNDKNVCDTNSGLLNYLFGNDQKKTLSCDKFLAFVREIQDELIELEFREYDKENTGRISEEELCNCLLKYANIPPKLKRKMLRRVRKEYPTKQRGVSLPSFKNLYYTLAGGDDLERAISYMDEGQGVTYQDLRRISLWVTSDEMSDHVARVVFVLMDDDEDGRLSWADMQNVFFNWRRARGYEKQAVNLTIGPKPSTKKVQHAY